MTLPTPPRAYRRSRHFQSDEVCSLHWALEIGLLTEREVSEHLMLHALILTPENRRMMAPEIRMCLSNLPLA